MNGIGPAIMAVLQLKNELSGPLQKATNDVTTSAARMKTNWAGVAAGAAAAFAAVGAVAKKALDAFGEFEASVIKLNTALGNQGNLLPGVSRELQEFAAGMADVSLFQDDAILSAQSFLASMGANAEQIKALTPAVLDYAQATGKDLNTAFVDVGKAFAGQTSALSKLGIDTKSVASESERLKTIQEGLGAAFGGQALAATKGWSGELAMVKKEAGEVLEEMGKFVRFLMVDLAGGVETTIRILKGIGSFFGETLPIVVSEARALFAEFVGSLFDVGAGVSEFLGKIPGMSSILPDPETLRIMAEGQRELAVEVRESADAFLLAGGVTEQAVASQRNFAASTSELTNEQKEYLKAITATVPMLRELRNWNLQAAEVGALYADTIEIGTDATRQMAKEMGVWAATNAEYVVKGGKATEVAEEYEKQQRFLNDAIQTGADIMRLFGIEADSTAGQFLSIGSVLVGSIPSMGSFNESMLANIDSLEDFAVAAQAVVQGIGQMAKATESGSAKMSAMKGAASGAATGGQLGGAWGAVIGAGVGALVGWFRGRGRERAIKDISNEIGVIIDEAMLKAIRDSGKSAQLFIGQIFGQAFEEGAGDVNRLAEEMGDIFSFLERGEISKFDAIKALEESVPLLIEHFDELGENGHAQLQRIFQAAESLGVEFEGLFELSQAMFAPETMEQIAATFGITNDQVRELSSLLGVSVQTDLERMAATLGLSVSEFEALGAAVKDKFGIPMDQIDELMASLGVSAEELAAALGVEVAAGAGGLTEETAAANAELLYGVDLSGQLAFNMERAAAAAGGILFGVGGVSSTPGFQHGGFMPETYPHGALVRVAEPGTGGEFMVPAKHAGVGAGGMSVVVNIDARGAIGLDKEALVHEVTKGIERNLAGSETRLKRRFGL